MNTDLISPQLTFIYLAIFAMAMVLITFVYGKKVATKSVDGFLVANRQVPWWMGGPSIAASWTWAMALMVSVQYSYDNGFAGAFWFTVPNVAALLIFMWLGPKIRSKLPNGYSLPEWIQHRFENKNTTLLYLVFCLYYQVMAVAVQVWAGANLLSIASGLPVSMLMPMLLVIALTYTMISGLAASIVTDFVQFLLIVIVGGLIMFLLFNSGAGFNFEGVSGKGGLNPFDPVFAFTVGLTTSIGLLSGSIADQQCWQRCFAIKERDIKKGFLLGGLLFGFVPLIFCCIGFLAAGQNLTLPANFDHSLVGFVLAKELLPQGIATIFVFVLLAGISSTLDSGLTATSSLSALVREKPWQKGESAKPSMNVTFARKAMLAIGLVGLLIGYMVEFVPGFQLKYLWWFFNTIAACMIVPTILSLTWDKLTHTGILYGSVLALFLGLPIVLYGSITQNDKLVTATNVGVILLSLAVCYICRKRQENP